MSRGKLHSFLVPVLTVIACLGLVISSSYADDWPSVLKKTRAKYAKYDETIHDITTQQKIMIVTPDRKITTEATQFKKKNKFRMENSIELPEMPKEMGPVKTIVIYDGQDTWMLSSMMGKQKLSGDDEKQYQSANDWWNFLSESAELTGTEEVAGRNCYVVKLSETDSSPYSTLWLDKKELILIKAESEVSGGQQVDMHFSEFKEIEGGWQMPYQTDLYMDGQLASSVKVVSIEVNKGLSDDLFDVDKADVKGPSMQDMMKMMQDQGGD